MITLTMSAAGPRYAAYLYGHGAAVAACHGPGRGAAQLPAWGPSAPTHATTPCALRSNGSFGRSYNAGAAVAQCPAMA